MDNTSFSRRSFIKGSGVTLAGATLLGGGVLSAFGSPSFGSPSTGSPLVPVQGNLTIQQVIDQIIATIPGGRLDSTVDTVKQGDAGKRCTGVVTTFMANAEVIKKAAAAGANFIITHEPTFYNHTDATDWLENDPVYQYKKKLIADTGMVLWRFHDYWHRHDPDGILEGFLEVTSWKKYQDAAKKNILTMPQATVEDIALYLKQTLNLQRPFIVGDPSMELTKVGLRLGASGGNSHLTLLGTGDVELLIVGEINEWETSEYVRDAVSAGLKRALLILGHQRSEEPGMKYLVGWMNRKFPDLKTTHVDAGDPFVGV